MSIPGLLVIFEYSNQFGTLVEVKVSAGTGLNLNVDVDAIALSVSGSTTFTVDLSSKPNAIPLFSGFSVSTFMQSMKLTLSGSGVVSGKLRFGGGSYKLLHVSICFALC